MLITPFNAASQLIILKKMFDMSNISRIITRAISLPVTGLANPRLRMLRGDWRAG